MKMLSGFLPGCFSSPDSDASVVNFGMDRVASAVSFGVDRDKENALINLLVKNLCVIITEPIHYAQVQESGTGNTENNAWYPTTTSKMWVSFDIVMLQGILKKHL
jgi:hypothetical protein